MKTLEAHLEGLGPARAARLTEAWLNYEAAKAVQVKLEQELQLKRTEQAELAPKLMVTAGVNVAELASATTLQSASQTLIAHLEDSAIPAARRAAQEAYRVVNSIVEVKARKLEIIERQLAIIEAAQEQIEAAQGWLDGE